MSSGIKNERNLEANWAEFLVLTIALDLHLGGAWWHTPLIPARGKQKQADLCEFDTNLINIANYRSEMHSETLSQKNKATQER